MDKTQVEQELAQAISQAVPTAAPAPEAMILTDGIISRVDTGRLLREIKTFDDHMHQAAIKKVADPAAIGSLSKQLSELAAVNHIDLSHAAQCQRTVEFLTSVHNSAPVMHMSFSAEPSLQFTKKLVSWLRKEIHPLVLVQVGLQPSIGAGCIVRTTNKYFDFSLRQRFKQKREQLLNFFSRANTIATIAQPAAVPATVETTPQ